MRWSNGSIAAAGRSQTSVDQFGGGLLPASVQSALGAARADIGIGIGSGSGTGSIGDDHMDL